MIPIIIILAFLIGIAYLIKIRSYDIYEKEPFGKLLLVMILGGIVSVITSLILYEFVQVKYHIFDAIFKIGLIEELSKLVALIVAYQIIKKEFNEIVDGIIYITAVSLGFSVIENIMYCMQNEAPFQLLLLRSVFATVGHISFTGYIGIAFYIHVRVHKNYFGLFLALILSSFAHGLYDGVLFHREVTVLFTLVYTGLVFFQLWFLRVSLGFSSFRQELAENILEETHQTATLHCNICENKVPSPVFSFWKIKAVKCSNCGSIVLNADNFYETLRYFRPMLRQKGFFKKLPDKPIVSLDTENQVLLNPKTRFLGARLPNLSQWLRESNETDRQKILRIPFIGLLLKEIGIKNLI